jgi:exosortase N
VGIDHLVPVVHTVFALSFYEIEKRLNVTLSYRWKAVEINWPVIILLMLGVVGGTAAFPADYLKASNVLVGLGLLPFVVFADGQRRINYIYLAALAFFTAAAYAYNVKLFYFFALAMYAMFILEAFVARINMLVLFLVGVASPVFTQISIILGFPIRLVLSDWACTLLATSGLPVRADGNLILYDGYSFTVDDACMGLSMMAISLLMGVFMISHLYKRSNKRLSFSYLSVFFSILFCLNILANLFRIILLVLFKIAPDDPMHEVTGILCVVFYTMIPLYFLARWIIRWKGRNVEIGETTKTIPSRRNLLLAAAVGFVVMVIGFTIDPVRRESEAAHAKVHMDGMTITELNDGVTKLTSDELLVYVKPIPEFFTSEHTPLICWKGSGFDFKQVKEDVIGGRRIFTGVLVNGGTKLYTAWWYTNGVIDTIDQFTWRRTMITSACDFNLVNVTASDEIVLRQKLDEMFIAGTLSIR